MATYLGLRGTGDWANTQLRDDDFRAAMFKINPNGDYPLTGIQGMLANTERTYFKKVEWATEADYGFSYAYTGLYQDASLSNAYSGSDTVAKGGTLYIKLPEVVAQEFVPGTIGMFVKTTSATIRKRFRVADQTIAGANSYLTITMLVADDASVATSIVNSNNILNLFANYAEGADTPKALTREEVPYENVTGIERTVLELTRSEFEGLNTKFKERDYLRIVERRLEEHMQKLEKMFLFSTLDKTSVGTNNKRQWRPQGLFDFIETYAANNVMDFENSAPYTGEKWIDAGEDFLGNIIGKAVVNGGYDRLGVTGYAGLRAIHQLAQVNGQFQLTEKTKAYGFKVYEFISPVGSIDLLVHALYNKHDMLSRSLLIYSPQNIRLRPYGGEEVRFYEDDRKENKFSSGKDLIQEEFVSEVTYEFYHPDQFSMAYGLGLDNVLL
jgi:hypothetical protein